MIFIPVLRRFWFSATLFRFATPLLLLVAVVSQQSQAQGFNATATPWSLPAGGYATSSHDYSYQTLSRLASSNSALDHSWESLDMNGDARPDLVVLTEGSGTFNEPFGTGTSRYWKVHLNTGAGYASTAIQWALPAGGRIVSGSGRLASFDALTYPGTSYTGNRGWSVKDMNGDGRPDLVVTSEGTGTYNEALGTGAVRHWDVYLNTGTGFAQTATAWPLPPGGYYDGTNHFYSYNALTYTETGIVGGNILSWFVGDMNGDQRPDLVVLTENYYVFGPNTAAGRYWKVYLNSGTAFATTATTWALPSGGYIYDTGGIGSTTIQASFNSLEHHETSGRRTGNQEWGILDMNGDAKPDLAVVTEFDGTYLEPFGTGTARYWKVYLNTGTGFSTTATTWTLPAGGGINANTGRRYSFNGLYGTGSILTGNQTWDTADLNGDQKPDLIILREGTGTYDDVFGTGTARYWRVYLSTGNGFSATATNWALPTGGYIASNHNYSFAALAYSGSSATGNQSWAVLDINGDAKNDLVVLTEGTGTYNDVFGTGTGRYWKAYLNSATVTATASAAVGACQQCAMAFPNPTTDQVVLQRVQPFIGQTYAVTDCAGRVILQGTIMAENQPVSLSSLSSGIYILQLGSQFKQSLRLVKQ